MIRGKWRTPLGIAFGVLASMLVKASTPDAMFPSGAVTAFLLSAGLVIPDWVFKLLEYSFTTAAPVGPAVAVGAVVCMLLAGADTVKRGVRLGFLVASLDVGIPLAVMIFIAVRGLQFPVSSWVVKILIQPVTAVIIGMTVGAIAALIQRLVVATRDRASSSL